MGFVYQLEFSNGKSYIGLTTQTLKHRVAQHRSLSKTSNLPVHAAWRKYGEPKVHIVTECHKNFLPIIEEHLILLKNTITPNGYNISPGGDMSPMLIPEIVEKIAAKKRGSKHTEQTKEKMRKAHAGRISPNKGKMFSETWKQNMAIAQTGRKHSSETKAKMAVARAAYWANKRASS